MTGIWSVMDDCATGAAEDGERLIYKESREKGDQLK